MAKPVTKTTVLCLMVALAGCQHKSNSTRAADTALEETTMQVKDPTADALYDETMAF